jgi:hypothetical protein
VNFKYYKMFLISIFIILKYYTIFPNLKQNPALHEGRGFVLILLLLSPVFLLPIVNHNQERTGDKDRRVRATSNTDN